MKSEMEYKIFSFLKKHLYYEDYVSVKQKYNELIKKDKTDVYREAYFVSRKKKAKKRYCILRLEMPDYMLFAAGNAYLFMYEWARKKGYIPIIDIEYTYNFEKYKLGKDNLWSLCFRQPVTVEEALESDWVLVESIGMPGHCLPEMCRWINSKENDYHVHIHQRNWKSYYARLNKLASKVWTFDGIFLEEYRKEYGCFFNKESRVLGLVLREAFSEDARKLRNDTVVEKIYQEHPLCPGIKEVVEIVRIYIEKWKCDKILISTAYEDSVELFKEEFGDMLIVPDRNRMTMLEAVKESQEVWRKDSKSKYVHSKSDNYMENMIVPYAKEILGISQCDYLLAAKSSGTSAALVLNGGKYKDIHILSDKNNSKKY